MMQFSGPPCICIYDLSTVGVRNLGGS